MLQFMGSQRVGHDSATFIIYITINFPLNYIKVSYRYHILLFISKHVNIHFLIRTFPHITTVQWSQSRSLVLWPNNGEGNGTPLQYSCLENPMDGGAWWAAVHGVTKSQTRLSDFTFTFHFHALEKEMATHSRVLAWRIPGTGEPGGLPSLGSHKVGHDWSDLAAAALY